MFDHTAPLLDRQLVQLFHVIRKRRQYLSQLRSFCDESLDQTRRRPVLLRCVVVGLRSCLCRHHCGQLAWDDVDVEHDAARSSGVLLVSQQLFEHHSRGSCRYRAEALGLLLVAPSAGACHDPELPSPHSSVCDVLFSLALVLSSRRLSAPPTLAPCSRLRILATNLTFTLDFRFGIGAGAG